MRSWSDYKKTMREEDEIFSLARAGDWEALQRLAASPTVVNQEDHKGYSPLMLAAYHGHLEAVRVLLAAGANPNGRDLGGSTILMGAAFKGHLAVVQALAEGGADVAAVNPKGQTALAFAQMFGRAEVARYLKARQDRDAVFGLRDVLSGWRSFFLSRRIAG